MSKDIIKNIEELKELQTNLKKYNKQEANLWNKLLYLMYISMNR